MSQSDFQGHVEDKPVHIRPSYKHPGWFKITAMFRGEIRDGWSQTKADAKDVGRGMVMAMEHQHRMAEERRRA